MSAGKRDVPFRAAPFAVGICFLIAIAAFFLWEEHRAHALGILPYLLPGFVWISPGAFVLGLVESFAYGLYVGLLFVPIHNVFWSRWGNPQASPSAKAA